VVVIIGGLISTVQETVREAEAVFPHASIAVQDLVCVREHPLLETLPSLLVIVAVPQASDTVALPSATSNCRAVGLHSMAVKVIVIVGVVTSAVHVAVRDVVAVLPHASVAVKVLVCERRHPVDRMLPVAAVTVGVLHPSVAVADPSAASIVPVFGLQPRASALPVAVIVGVDTSIVHVIVLDAVAVLPQASVAVNVLVCVAMHPALVTAPSEEVTVGVPQASVAVAVPSAPLIRATAGLQPKVNVVPDGVRTGGVTSAVHVAVREVVAVLPHASIAVNFLVCERTHPLVTTAASVEEIVGAPQASVAVADPSAASMFAVPGLHPRARLLPVAVIPGGVTSVTLKDLVQVLVQPLKVVVSVSV
jgi:hypothetical protein